MRRVVLSLGVAVLLVGVFAVPAGAVSAYTMATWKASFGANAVNGTGVLTASSLGAGSLVLRARHLPMGLATYTVTIRRGKCSAQGALVASLPSSVSTRGGSINRTYSLTTAQMKPVLKFANALALWITKGSTQRCGVLAVQLPAGVVGLNRQVLIRHTASGAIGVHWLTVLAAETWEPPVDWDGGPLGDGEVALAVHIRIDAVEATNYGPDYFAIRTPGHVDIPPRPGQEPKLQFGSLAIRHSVDGRVTFVVHEDELDQLTLLYSPASGVIIRFALS